MSTLISHSGAVEVTHDQLNRLEEPKPLTETHTPIHHGRFVSLVKQEIEKQGFEIIREEFSLRQGAPEMAPNGFRATNGFDDLFGLIKVKGTLEGVDHSIGVRGSNTMNFSRQLGAGNHVMVCDNLCFFAQVILGRKHTANIWNDLPDMVGVALNEIAVAFEYDKVRTEVYRNSRISDQKAHDVMMRSIQGGNKDQQTPASKLGAWVNEWLNPSHDEFKPRNAWSLINAHTEVAKSWGFDSMAKRTEKVQGIMDFGLGVHGKAKDALSDRYTAEQIDACEIAFAA